MRQIFPEVREAVARVIDPAKLRWISFSHFEADECGSLNEWLATAPQATAVCSFVGANVSVNDFANRPGRAMQNDEVLVPASIAFIISHLSPGTGGDSIRRRFSPGSSRQKLSSSSVAGKACSTRR